MNGNAVPELSRRQFLAVSALGASLPLLAGCDSGPLAARPNLLRRET